jgi:hypothetical protein
MRLASVEMSILAFSQAAFASGCHSTLLGGFDLDDVRAEQGGYVGGVGGDVHRRLAGLVEVGDLPLGSAAFLQPGWHGRMAPARRTKSRPRRSCTVPAVTPKPSLPVDGSHDL